MLSLLMSCSVYLYADATADFYSGIVPVPDRSQESFKLGMRDALLQTLVKASAESPETISNNPLLIDDFNRAETFALQFLYKIQTDEQKNTQVFLKATFAEKSIMDLLKKANLRFWSSRRPVILLLPVENNNGFNSITANTDALLAQQLLASSEKYGIPFNMGADNIDAMRIWYANTDYIQQLMKQSQKKFAVVIQLLNASSTVKKGKWLLFDESQMLALTVNAAEWSEFSDKGMAWVAQQLVQQHSINLVGESNQLELPISGIDNYAKYESLVSYVKSISIIEQAQLIKIEKGIATWVLKLTADQEQLEKIFTLDKKIIIQTIADKKTYSWRE